MSPSRSGCLAATTHHSERDRERYPRFALSESVSVANEGEKFRSRRTPYAMCHDRLRSPRSIRFTKRRVTETHRAGVG